MRRKSTDERIVRRRASEIRHSTVEELSGLATKKDEKIDLSDIPERKNPADRVIRDSRGRIVTHPRSMIREAILTEIKQRGISGHELWLKARKRCGTIPESAVYEFLSGKRQVGLAYLDAMLAAMDLSVSKRS